MKDRSYAPASPLPAKVSIHLVTLGPRPSRVATVISNRYTPRIELLVTHSKQTAVVLSNRYKYTPSGEIASWLSHRSILRISLAASGVAANRYTVRIEFTVTPSKQTTLILSNRYTGTPPGARYYSSISNPDQLSLTPPDAKAIAGIPALDQPPWPKGTP